MRIRSGHILVMVGAFICALVIFVLVEGGGTSARDTAPDPGASLPPAGSDPGDVPVIEVETTEKDMGVVSNVEKTRKPFIVRNKGKAALQIREIKTSCACTQAKLPQDGMLIPPMGEGKFEIEIDPMRIPGFEARRVLTIVSNDIAKPQIEVGVTSHVDPELSLEPSDLDFGEVQKGSEPKRTLLVRQIREEPIDVTEINTFGNMKKDSKEGAAFVARTGDFTFAVAKRPENTWAKPGKAEFELTIGLTANASAGSLDGKYIYVVTNVKRLSAMGVALKGKIVAPYTLSPVAPQKLNIKGDVTTHEYTPAYAVVSAQTPVTIEGIEAKAPVIAEAEAGTTPNEAKLKVTIAPGAPSGPIEEELHFNVVIGGTKYPERVGVRSFSFGGTAAQK